MLIFVFLYICFVGLRITFIFPLTFCWIFQTVSGWIFKNSDNKKEQNAEFCSQESTEKLLTQVRFQKKQKIALWYLLYDIENFAWKYAKNLVNTRFSAWYHFYTMQMSTSYKNDIFQSLAKSRTFEMYFRIKNTQQLQIHYWVSSIPVFFC